MVCKQVTPDELTELLRTHPDITGSATLEECENGCGRCCVPTCPGTLTNYATSINCGGGSVQGQSLIPNPWEYALNTELGLCFPGGTEQNLNLTTTVTDNLLRITIQPNGGHFFDPLSTYRSDIKAAAAPIANIINTIEYSQDYELARNSAGTYGNELSPHWAPGYPNGTYFVESRSVYMTAWVRPAMYFNCPSENVVNPSSPFCNKALSGQGGSIIDGQGNNYLAFVGASKTIRRIKYFQCVDGLLEDKTSDAFVPSANDVINWTTGSWSAEGDTIAPPDGLNERVTTGGPGFSGVSDLEFPVVSQVDGFLTEQNLFPSLSDSSLGGVTSLVYQCADINQDQCSGIWRPGQGGCAGFDCNT